MIKRLALLLLALQLSAVTKAELMIEITQGMDNPAPIAIVPFAGTEGHRENIPDIVAADLQRSGFFRPIPKADMLSTPHYERDVFYRDWRILGAEFLVIGRLQAGVAAGTNPDQYVLEYALYDVLGQRNLFKKVAKGSASELRDIAHEVSDAVYEAITGIRGAFSTKILYIEDLKRAGRGALPFGNRRCRWRQRQSAILFEPTAIVARMVERSKAGGLCFIRNNAPSDI